MQIQTFAEVGADPALARTVAPVSFRASVDTRSTGPLGLLRYASGCWPTRVLLALLLGMLLFASSTARSIIVDERLSMPRNYVAYDSGQWSSPTTLVNEAALIEGTPGGGVFFSECLGFEEWHPQHIVRLPNKNGRAYFMYSNSNSGTPVELSFGGGWISLMEIDENRLDENDLVIVEGFNTPVGSFIWSDVYTTSSPVGHFNHPAKMEVIGNLLVVAAQNWVPTFLCDVIGQPNTIGTSPMALLFYDIRDPSRPKYWGKIEGGQIRRESAQSGLPEISSVGISRIATTNGGVPLEEWFLTASGGDPQIRRTVKALPEQLIDLVDPTPADLWISKVTIPPGAGVPFDVDARQHGMLFDSYETTAPGDGGKERNMFFDKVGDSDTFAFWENRYFDDAAPAAHVTTSQFYPMALPQADRHWNNDSIYVTEFGMPVIYTMESNWRLPNWDGVFFQVYDPRNLAMPIGQIGDKIVTNTNDRGPGSLRNAIGYGGHVTFDLPPGDDRIELTGGPLVVYRHDVTIDASSVPNGLTIDARGRSRVVEVAEGRQVVLRNLTLTGGSALQGGGLLNDGGSGTLENCVVTGNSTAFSADLRGDGGGILNNVLMRDNGDTEQRYFTGRDVGLPAGHPALNGYLKLVESTVSDNHAGNHGGGIANVGGTLVLERSAVTNNTADYSGGAIANRAGLYDFTFGVSSGLVLIENSTIAQNEAALVGHQLDVGAAIFNEHAPENCLYAQVNPLFCQSQNTVLINHSTIADNSNLYLADAESSAGVFNETGGTLILENSIVWNNTTGATGVRRDLKGTYSTQGIFGGLFNTNNVVSNLTGAVLQNGIDPIAGNPRLMPLANYGGPTETMQPTQVTAARAASGSRSILASPPTSNLTLDQRGVARPVPPKSLGAFEVVHVVTAVDFSTTDPFFLQPGFFAQGATDTVTSITSGPGGSQLMTIDVPASSLIVTRANSQLLSSGSSFVADGTDIGQLSEDYLFRVEADAHVDIRITNLQAQRYVFEGWFSDLFYGQGAFLQKLEVSTDGGASFRTVATDIGAGGLNPTPVRTAFTPIVGQVVVIRVTENNPEDQLRINGFALSRSDLPSVSNLGDSTPGSLRHAIATSLAGDRITFDSALSGQSIPLTTGEILIDKDLTIDASALPAGLVLDGGGLGRIFTIAAGATVSLIGVEIRNGSETVGGGILNNGDLTLVDCSFEGNHAVLGAGLMNGATTRVERCTFSDNVATSVAGGIWNSASADLTLINTTISGNQANQGGALINLQGNVALIHSTISGNAASSSAGGIGNDAGTVTIESSIVAGNGGPVPIYGADFANWNGGTIVSVGANLVGDNDTVSVEFPAGPLVGTQASPKDPRLLPLGDYGGPTRTRHPLLGSPVIDAALTTAQSPTTDQRRSARGFDGDGDTLAENDLGAVEVPEPGGMLPLMSGLWVLWRLGRRGRRVGGGRMVRFEPDRHPSSEAIPRIGHGRVEPTR
ncbi:MAG: hypothetical protein IPK00_19315 [Deltaproteobacteria bacterium]|nr:hypothetical protein [Deltaproteobacteria bacterium]